MSIICYCICTKRGYGVEKDRMRQRDCQEGRGGELCKLQKEHGQHDVIPVPDGCLWEVSLMIGMISVLYTVVSCMNE